MVYTKIRIARFLSRVPYIHSAVQWQNQACPNVVILDLLLQIGFQKGKASDLHDFT